MNRKRSYNWIIKVRIRKAKLKECKVFLISGSLFLLGFFALCIAKKFLNIQQDVTYITILLLPFLAYLILSGKLSEFSAGGISAKFIATAEKPLQDMQEKLIEPLFFEKLETRSKGNDAELEKILKKFNSLLGSKYLILTIKIKESYEIDLLIKYLKSLARFPRFKFLVVLDEYNQLIGYISYQRAINLLEGEKLNLSSGFIEAIEQCDTPILFNYYGLINNTVRNTDTYQKALEKMTESGADEFIIIDENKVLVGVVEREQLLSKLVLATIK